MIPKRRKLCHIGRVGEYCNRCMSLFSTPENLQALASAPGYKHYDKRQLKVEAEKGCTLCKVILEQYSLKSLNHAEEICFIASRKDRNISENDGVPDDSSYPFETFSWKGIWGLNSEGKLGVSLNMYCPEGKFEPVFSNIESANRI